MSFAHTRTAEANRRRKAGALAATAWTMDLPAPLDPSQRSQVLRATDGVARASDLTWRLVDQLLDVLDTGGPAALELGPQPDDEQHEQEAGDAPADADAPWWA